MHAICNGFWRFCAPRRCATLARYLRDGGLFFFMKRMVFKPFAEKVLKHTCLLTVLRQIATIAFFPALLGDTEQFEQASSDC